MSTIGVNVNVIRLQKHFINYSAVAVGFLCPPLEVFSPLLSNVNTTGQTSVIIVPAGSAD